MQKEKILKIINGLAIFGYNWVYILPATGRYKGEKDLDDFAIGLRDSCYYIGKTPEEWGCYLQRVDLEDIMLKCLSEGIELVDVRTGPAFIPPKRER